MILEGVVTTLNADGTVAISPMGPIIDADFRSFELRPFQTSTTFQNLRRIPAGVLHIVDDVMLVAQGAIKRWKKLPELIPAQVVHGQRIAKACQAFEFQATIVDNASERTSIQCEIVHVHDGPRFFGFNRAKHAVLEAAILATRVELLPLDEIQTKFDELEVIVGKTGGEQEQAAFDLLDSFVNEFAR